MTRASSPSSVGGDTPWVDLTLAGKESLSPDNAVAAILVLPDGRYIMQLRDSIPKIYFPGHWGCFGGAVNPGESPVEALKRELQEEIEFTPAEATEFTRFDFDFSRLGHPSVYRIYFIVHVPADAMEKFVLHEGTRYSAIRGQELLNTCRVTPYDSFAIWMHLSATHFNHV